jgi:hypothetical protein
MTSKGPAAALGDVFALSLFPFLDHRCAFIAAS